MSENERVLVSVKPISEIKPIPDADKIELATIDGGWGVVVRKGEFSPGDLCVYHEIDSILPVGVEAYDFLTKGKKPYRLRTARLRGQISQGLALPFSAFKPSEIPSEELLGVDFDLTELLGVQLYEDPLPKELEDIATGRFPFFIKKVMPTRIQNCFGKLQYNTSHDFEITRKLDGSYLAVWNQDGNIGLATKRVAYDITKPSLYRNVLKQTGWLDAMQLPEARNLAVMGEIAGEGIRKNRQMLSGQNFYVFDLFDIAQQRYLNPKERTAMLVKLIDAVGNPDKFEPLHVPFINSKIQLESLGLNSVSDALDWVETFNKTRLDQKGRATVEGVVLTSYNDPTFKVKIISNQYLLDHGL